MASEEDFKVAREVLLSVGHGSAVSANQVDELTAAVATAITAARAETWKEAIAIVDRLEKRCNDRGNALPSGQDQAEWKAATRWLMEAKHALEAAAGSKTKVVSEDEQKESRKSKRVAYASVDDFKAEFGYKTQPGYSIVYYDKR